MSEFIQGTQEWLDLRKKYIGASDSPIIMGTSTFKLADGRVKTPYLLWQEKLGLVNLNSASYATKYGNDTEPVARALYEKMTGNLVAPKVIFHKDILFLMASLDGLCFDESIAVEIKCINKNDHELARQGIIPAQYKPQVYHQLECLGHDKMHYFSYHQGEGIIVTVHKDDEYQNLLKEKLLEFWHCVEEFIAPAMTEYDFTEKDHQWKEIAELLMGVKNIIKNYQLQHDLLEEKLQELSNNQNCMSGIYKYTKSLRKGNLDYSSIPELENINLEAYRKEPTYSWRLTKVKS